MRQSSGLVLSLLAVLLLATTALAGVYPPGSTTTDGTMGTGSTNSSNTVWTYMGIQYTMQWQNGKFKLSTGNPSYDAGYLEFWEGDPALWEWRSGSNPGVGTLDYGTWY